jgi:crossover junction endodeoxyribonuclease RuvC
MRVLGVDPGSLATGWGLLAGSATNPRLIEAGVLRLAGEASLAGRLALLQRGLTELVERLDPGVAAVEAPFHGASARSALVLAHARGVALAVLASAGVEVVEYSPAAVKKAVTGNGRAGKRQVASMVVRLIGSDLDTRAHDLSDALAVALCHQSVAGFSGAGRRAERGR